MLREDLYTDTLFLSGGNFEHQGELNYFAEPKETGKEIHFVDVNFFTNLSLFGGRL